MKTTKEVSWPSVSFLVAADEVKDKLKDLNNLLNRKTPADMTGVCDAVMSSAAAFKKMNGVGPLANEPLDMVILGCDRASACTP